MQRAFGFSTADATALTGNIGSSSSNKVSEWLYEGFNCRIRVESESDIKRDLSLAEEPKDNSSKDSAFFIAVCDER